MYSEARKTKSFGRPSGGIAIFVKKRYEKNVFIIAKTYLWVSIGIKIGDLIYVIVSCYWNPSSNIDYCIHGLSEHLNYIKEKYGQNLVLIVVGDFNARVGVIEKSEELIFNNTLLYYPRNSCDQTINKRRRLLLEMLGDLSLELCNGRSMSDKTGDFIFLSSSGKSTIDLAQSHWLKFDSRL